MKIADIIGNENGQAIYLHKEGIFWRAYEYSAYGFWVEDLEGFMA